MHDLYDGHTGNNDQGGNELDGKQHFTEQQPGKERRPERGEVEHHAHFHGGDGLQRAVVQHVADGGIDDGQPGGDAPRGQGHHRHTFNHQGSAHGEDAAQQQRDGRQGEGIHLLVARKLPAQYGEQGETQQRCQGDDDARAGAGLPDGQEEQGAPHQRKHNPHDLPGGRFFLQPHRPEEQDDERLEVHQQGNGGGGQELQPPEHGSVADEVGADANDQQLEPHFAGDGAQFLPAEQQDWQQHQPRQGIAQPGDGQRTHAAQPHFDDDERGGPDQRGEHAFDDGEGAGGFMSGWQ